MIFRKAERSRYTVIDNEVLRNSELSFRARGLMAYILSLPDNWEIKTQHLINEGKEGRDAIRKAMSELKEAGYLKTVKIQNEKGHWSTVTYVYESPEPGSQAPVDPSTEQSDNRLTGNPSSGGPGAIRITEEEVPSKKEVLSNTSNTNSKGEEKISEKNREDLSTLLTSEDYANYLRYLESPSSYKTQRYAVSPSIESFILALGFELTSDNSYVFFQLKERVFDEELSPEEVLSLLHNEYSEFLKVGPDDF